MSHTTKDPPKTLHTWFLLRSTETCSLKSPLVHKSYHLASKTPRVQVATSRTRFTTCKTLTSRDSIRECFSSPPPPTHQPETKKSCSNCSLNQLKSFPLPRKSPKKRIPILFDLKDLKASSTALNLLYSSYSPALPFQASSRTCATSQHACSAYETFRISFKLPTSWKWIT